MTAQHSILRSNQAEPKLRWMVLISLFIHLAVIMYLLGKPPDRSEKIFYSPVYSVNLVDMPPVSSVSKNKNQGISKIRKGSLWNGPDSIASYVKTTGKRSHAMLTIPKKVKIKGTKRGTKNTNISDDSKNSISDDSRGGAAGTGSQPAAGAGTANLRFSRYYHSIWRKIQNEWILPSYDYRKSRHLEAIVIIKIDRSGKILNIDFEKKSGDTKLDRSVIRAIKKASPLPPLPTGFREKHLEIGIRFIPEDL